jgi:hypothetical protein
VDRLEPALSSFKQIFPEASVTLYSDRAWLHEGLTVHEVLPPFDASHPRFGWRAHDYYQAEGLLRSKADIAIALDSDFEIVSPDFDTLTVLAAAFGLCVPMNPRLLLRIDGSVGTDSTYDVSANSWAGTSLTYNLTPIAFSTKHSAARQLLEEYTRRMVERPGRGGVHLAEASFDLGFQPNILPPQWCVSSPADLDSKHIWAHPIALHVGHRDVWPKLRYERRRASLKAFAKRILGR